MDEWTQLIHNPVENIVDKYVDRLDK